MARYYTHQGKTPIEALNAICLTARRNGVDANFDANVRVIREALDHPYPPLKQIGWRYVGENELFVMSTRPGRSTPVQPVYVVDDDTSSRTASHGDNGEHVNHTYGETGDSPTLLEHLRRMHDVGDGRWETAGYEWLTKKHYELHDNGEVAPVEAKDPLEPPITAETPRSPIRYVVRDPQGHIVYTIEAEDPTPSGQPQDRPFPSVVPPAQDWGSTPT